MKSNPKLIRCASCLALGLGAILFLCAAADINSLDPAERKAAIASIDDQTQLATLALQDTDSDVRTAALYKLKDQAVIAKVATKDDSRFVRSAAVFMLRDQTVLAKIATQDEDLDVRLDAGNKITDQSVLATIAEDESGNPIFRQNAIGWLKDQTALAKLAQEAKVTDVRAAAVVRVTDQAVVAKVVVEDKEETVRESAVKVLTDQAVLAKVAATDDAMQVRELAVCQLSDQALLTSLASSDDKATAAAKLADQIVHMRLFLADPDIQAQIGQTKFDVLRNTSSQDYTQNLATGDVAGKATGEEITFMIQRVALQTTEMQEWDTQFPTEVSTFDYLPAKVDFRDAEAKLLKDVSPADLAKLAQSAADQDVRDAAKSKLDELQKGPAN